MPLHRYRPRLAPRRLPVVLTTALAALASCAVAAGAASAPPAQQVQASSILVDGPRAFPESIAAGHRWIYTGSIATGTIFRGRPGSRTLRPFLPGGEDGRTEATGIKVDGDRLLVAGAFTGRFFIYTDTGRLVASYTVAAGAGKTLVNDETVAPNGDVYVTDSLRAVLYRIPARQVEAAPTGAHRLLPVAERLPHYVAGVSNANGITTTPNGKSLIIGYWHSGVLYRMTLATGAIHPIAGPHLTSEDGIARRGNTLYIARSVNNEVATVRLTDHATRDVLVSEQAYRGIDTPTGVAISSNRLLVSNSQLDTFLYHKPLTSSRFVLKSLPLH